jgi:hypothetical protein
MKGIGNAYKDKSLSESSSKHPCPAMWQSEVPPPVASQGRLALALSFVQKLKVAQNRRD